MSSDTEKLQLVLALLAELGINPAELSADAPTPTVTEYLPRLVAAASAATQRNYGPYWRKAAELFGDRKLVDLRTSDILALQRHAARTATQRRSNRSGRHAGEHATRAMRYLCRLAAADGLLNPARNPATSAPLPRRLPTTRHGLSPAQIGDIIDTVATSGLDPGLDTLLLRLHLETACRRGGALALQLRDLDATYCRILLREKFGTHRWQPISPTLTMALHDHAAARGACRPTDSLLRYRNGSPLTARRYDILWGRVHEALPWAEQLGISTHWLRHTTLTWVERHFGYAVARAYAGHTDAKGGSTLTYIRALPEEVAAALSALVGEPHPLVLPRQAPFNVTTSAHPEFARRTVAHAAITR
jgi:site-specific recombinase XerD